MLQPTKGMFSDTKRGEAGFWLNQGEVEGGFGCWHWYIDTETRQIYMVMI